MDDSGLSVSRSGQLGEWMTVVTESVAVVNKVDRWQWSHWSVTVVNKVDRWQWSHWSVTGVNKVDRWQWSHWSVAVVNKVDGWQWSQWSIRWMDGSGLSVSHSGQ